MIDNRGLLPGPAVRERKAATSSLRNKNMAIPRDIRIIAVLAVLAGVGLLAWHRLVSSKDCAVTN